MINVYLYLYIYLYIQSIWGPAHPKEFSSQFLDLNVWFIYTSIFNVNIDLFMLMHYIHLTAMDSGEHIDAFVIDESLSKTFNKCIFVLLVREHPVKYMHSYHTYMPLSLLNVKEWILVHLVLRRKWGVTWKSKNYYTICIKK